ncbi:TetR family transcriptional regulator [Kribbella lupini]|uniref:TetR/AcrR family transcriptional regulator n=1 Tax=Kribbella lupini TaxID=291602 RepID=A0ABN2AJ79_9ACTN
MEKRSRNAAATRQAILESAMTAFTKRGYDGAGVREIATDAGVTAMLVNRYFGSKEELFAEVVDTMLAPPTMVPGESGASGGAEAASEPETRDESRKRVASRELARETAKALAARTAPGADHLGPFELMLRSAANPRAAEILRAGIERHVGARFADALEGPGTHERAELGLALLAGVWLLRTVIGTPALREADSALLVEQLTSMLSVVVEQ